MDSSDSSSGLRWRLLRWAFIGIAGLIALLGGLWGEENERGKRAWETYKRQLEASGEKLDFDSYIPPTVSDDQNFAMTPFLAPLFDFTPASRPGNSIWRDTNSQRQTMDFASDLPAPKAADDNRDHDRLANLGAWAAAFRLKANPKAATNFPPTRAAAATEVLTALKKYAPVLEELRSAGQRPYSRFNIRYGDGPATLLPHLAVLKRSAVLFQLRALAELEAAQPDAAVADIKMIFRLSDSITNEPFLICGLVRIATVEMAMTPIWEGLAGHRWSADQISGLEQSLAHYDLLPEFGQGLRGERAAHNHLLDQLRNRTFNQKDLGLGLPPLPSGWIYQNQLVINRMFQERILAGVDPANGQVDPGDISSGSELDKELVTGFRPYKILAQMLVPAVGKATGKFAYAQTSIKEATIACALERYRLANGQFPEKLPALVPQFLAKLPHDLIGGGPLKYRRTDDGQFILYSIGWNEQDDGGKVAFTAGNSKNRDTTQGDWVWTSRIETP